MNPKPRPLGPFKEEKVMKNRTTQLIYQTAYCTLGVVGIAASLGFFEHVFRWDFYIMYTNLSNYFCIFVMFAELMQTARKKENSYVTVSPALKFIGMLGILLTFLVFNILLANVPGRNPAENFKIASVLAHVVLPIMYTLDWFLFYERGKTKLFYPFVSVLFPIAYLGYVFIHAAAHSFDSTITNYLGTDPLIYPYFFLNPDKVGNMGVLKWCVILTAIFAVGGLLFVGIDKLFGRRNK